jgi:hypothetical protein
MTTTSTAAAAAAAPAAPAAAAIEYRGAPAVPDEFDHEFELERGRWLRRRFLWMCGVFGVLAAAGAAVEVVVMTETRNGSRLPLYTFRSLVACHAEVLRSISAPLARAAQMLRSTSA